MMTTRPKKTLNSDSMKTTYWKIYPEKPVKGFCATYVKSDEDFGVKACVEAHKMERASGVRWCVKQVGCDIERKFTKEEIERL